MYCGELQHCTWIGSRTMTNSLWLVAISGLDIGIDEQGWAMASATHVSIFSGTLFSYKLKCKILECNGDGHRAFAFHQCQSCRRLLPFWVIPVTIMRNSARGTYFTCLQRELPQLPGLLGAMLVFGYIFSVIAVLWCLGLCWLWPWWNDITCWLLLWCQGISAKQQGGLVRW